MRLKRRHHRQRRSLAKNKINKHQAHHQQQQYSNLNLTAIKTNKQTFKTIPSKQTI